MSDGADQENIEGTTLVEGSKNFSGWVDSCVADINSRIVALMDEAIDVATVFWDFRYCENCKRRGKFKHTSKLGVRVRNKGKYYTIEWFYNEIVKDKKGKYIPVSHYLKKGTNKSVYSDSTLIRRCQPWEVEMVLEIEKRLAFYRETYSVLVAVRRDLNKLQKVIRERNKGDDSNKV
ncbi:hypothetical protein SAMN05660420_01801 [Desulfuromusa kysingii]|uniref:Uncharacterized protein n=1 Tax=Desulfuromusa kysingii TaxID=37625 RepID=A0A1H4AF17_9BACT|nr:conjugative transfer protein MobI(A/C) [Desulfuromusa kysingii]SEA34328.1 hypothetical protein SAMN05660420_01801 [Desulfuromusa kysingii]